MEEEIARLGGGSSPEEEHGVPGHGGGADWAKRLQSFLREKGFSFEAEGEAIRIHVGLLGVEVVEHGDGYAVVVTAPLPASSSDAGDEETARALRDALSVLAGLGADEISYEVEEDVPGYPVLRATVAYGDPGRLAESLEKALSRLAGGRGSSSD